MARRRSLRLLVLHGPNLNLLGTREPSIYGKTTLAEVDEALAELSVTLGVVIDCRQSNHEGELIDWLHEARTAFDGILINPAAYTHTFLALRDAIAACDKPCVEVHLSNIHAREEIRQKSLVSAVCVGTVAGFGATSYTLGLQALVNHLTSRGAT